METGEAVKMVEGVLVKTTEVCLGDSDGVTTVMDLQQRGVDRMTKGRR
jgi:hypothetical protein